MQRESMDFDVVIVGAGPAGLSASIRLKQLAAEKGRDISVCVLEKSAEVGGHILSGAVIETRALDELLPDWRDLGSPLTVPAGDDSFLFLTESKALRLPTPPQMHNAGNYVVSVGALCRWLAEQAETMGMEIYPGFAAAEVLYDDQGRVVGVATGDMGLDRNGNPTELYQPGMELRAKQVLFAEGVRGSLTEQVIARLDLRKGKDPQVYGIGIKELWDIDPAKHKPGKVVHTVGWPMDSQTYGGSFLYHLENNQVAVGFVVALDYANPHLSPFDEFQRFKTHPAIRTLFEGGKRVAYGARAISEGGFQSIPTLSFPGGLLIGDAAGFLNVPKIKGTHTAMKSGMLAAEAVFETLAASCEASEDGEAAHGLEAKSFQTRLERSWVWDELKRVRNIRPGFAKGLWLGLINAAIDTYLFQGRAPWTMRHRHPDHTSLRPAADMPKIAYPKPDGVLTFDKLSSVYLSATNHAEEQPCHLKLKDSSVPISVNLARYDGPEARYCPAGVYEFVADDTGEKKLQINFQNCVHCKTCDIKDPTQNIVWTTPQGGEGPNYPNM